MVFTPNGGLIGASHLPVTRQTAEYSTLESNAAAQRTPTNVTKEGYTFLGWQQVDTDGNPLNPGAALLSADDIDTMPQTTAYKWFKAVWDTVPDFVFTKTCEDGHPLPNAIVRLYREVWSNEYNAFIWVHVTGQSPQTSSEPEGDIVFTLTPDTRYMLYEYQAPPGFIRSPGHWYVIMDRDAEGDFVVFRSDPGNPEIPPIVWRQRGAASGVVGQLDTTTFIESLFEGRDQWVMPASASAGSEDGYIGITPLLNPYFPGFPGAATPPGQHHIQFWTSVTPDNITTDTTPIMPTPFADFYDVDFVPGSMVGTATPNLFYVATPGPIRVWQKDGYSLVAWRDYVSNADGSTGNPFFGHGGQLTSHRLLPAGNAARVTQPYYTINTSRSGDYGRVIMSVFRAIDVWAPNHTFGSLQEGYNTHARVPYNVGFVNLTPWNTQISSLSIRLVPLCGGGALCPDPAQCATDCHSFELLNPSFADPLRSTQSNPIPAAPPSVTPTFVPPAIPASKDAWHGLIPFNDTRINQVRPVMGLSQGTHTQTIEILHGDRVMDTITVTITISDAAEHYGWFVANRRIPPTTPIFDFYKVHFQATDVYPFQVTNYLDGAVFVIERWYAPGSEWVNIATSAPSGDCGTPGRVEFQIEFTDTGQYRLREIVAPLAFNLPPGHWNISVSGGKATGFTFFETCTYSMFGNTFYVVIGPEGEFLFPNIMTRDWPFYKTDWVIYDPDTFDDKQFVPGAVFRLYAYNGRDIQNPNHGDPKWDARITTGMVGPANDGYLWTFVAERTSGPEGLPMMFPMMTGVRYYRLVEAVAPVGFMPVAAQWRIRPETHIGSDPAGRTLHIWQMTADTPGVVVVNRAQWPEHDNWHYIGNWQLPELPLTGGTGMSMMLVASGTMLIAAAGAVIAFKKAGRTVWRYYIFNPYRP